MVWKSVDTSGLPGPRHVHAAKLNAASTIANWRCKRCICSRCFALMMVPISLNFAAHNPCTAVQRVQEDLPFSNVFFLYIFSAGRESRGEIDHLQASCRN